MYYDSSSARAVILTAPSGAGKTSIANYLLAHESRLAYSISACTRARRAEEEDGVDYYYLSLQAFKKHIENNDFIEWEEVYANSYYGTLKKEIQRLWAAGKTILFVVDVQGAQRLNAYFGERALSLFIKPPSVEVLRRRLKSRNSETSKQMDARMDKVAEEMRYQNAFDHGILNDKLPEAQAQTLRIVQAFIDK